MYMESRKIVLMILHAGQQRRHKDAWIKHKPLAKPARGCSTRRLGSVSDAPNPARLPSGSAEPEA